METSIISVGIKQPIQGNQVLKLFSSLPFTSDVQSIDTKGRDQSIISKGGGGRSQYSKRGRGQYLKRGRDQNSKRGRSQYSKKGRGQYSKRGRGLGLLARGRRHSERVGQGGEQCDVVARLPNIDIGLNLDTWLLDFRCSLTLSYG